jgi:hypothetical protein
MSNEFIEFKNVLANLHEQLNLFRVDFMDRQDFKNFSHDLPSKLGTWNEIYITGYFSEAVRKDLEKLAEWKKLKIISIKFNLKNERDRKNLEALKKLSKVKGDGTNNGVEIKVNNMLHARFIVAFNQSISLLRGVLILGSFDFNTEGIAGVRFDAGVKTQNPDLVRSAVKLFN